MSRFLQPSRVLLACCLVGTTIAVGGRGGRHLQAGSSSMTASASATASITATASRTSTMTATQTNTASMTATASRTSSATHSATHSATMTRSSTATASPTATPSASYVPPLQCFTAPDIVFLLDESGSIGAGNYQHALQVCVCLSWGRGGRRQHLRRWTTCLSEFGVRWLVGSSYIRTCGLHPPRPHSSS